MWGVSRMGEEKRAVPLRRTRGAGALPARPGKTAAGPQVVRKAGCAPAPSLWDMRPASITRPRAQPRSAPAPPPRLGIGYLRSEAVMRVLANHPRLSRLLAALALSAGLTGLLAPAASATTAKPMPMMEGWMRLAHLSPNTPAVDVYLYSLSDPHATLVLHHVPYGTVSPYLKVAPGEYTVAMRGPGAPTSSLPALATTVHLLAARGHLKIDDLLDAAGSMVMPMGAVKTGLGGTAPRPPAPPAPWLVTVGAGGLLALAGGLAIRRARRRPQHAE